MTDPRPLSEVVPATMATWQATNEQAQRRGYPPTEPSPAEVDLLCAMLSIGLTPQQQVPFGRYDVDFYFPDANVAIEVDGKHHNRQADTIRDQWLHDEHAIRTARISARHVFEDADACALEVKRLLKLVKVK